MSLKYNIIIIKTTPGQTDAHFPMDIGLTIKWQREVGGLVDFNLVLGLNLNRNFIILQLHIVGQK